MTDAEEAEALAAIDAVIDDFAHDRVTAYFAGFAEDATFVFHNAPRRLESRAQYEALWAQWQRESGFRVLACSSTDRRIQMFPGVGVFSHSVETRISAGGRVETHQERETIVVAKRGDRWICVHEHLSALD